MATSKVIISRQPGNKGRSSANIAPKDAKSFSAIPAFEQKDLINESPGILNAAGKSPLTPPFQFKLINALVKLRPNQPFSTNKPVQKRSESLTGVAFHQQQLVNTPYRSIRDGVIQKMHGSVIQMVKYANCEAKFRTDNEIAEIENSEYHITPTGYERYAPINKYRVPSQFFHEGNRTFMYFNGDAAMNRMLDFVDAYDVEGIKSGENVKFEAPDAKQEEQEELENISASWKPENGLDVLDCNMLENGTIDRRGYHPGHAVEDLGEELPELDKPGKLQELRILQTWMKHILSTSQLKMEGKNIGERDIMKVFEGAHKKGIVSEEEMNKYLSYKELLDELFGAMEKELIDNWTFYTK